MLVSSMTVVRSRGIAGCPEHTFEICAPEPHSLTVQFMSWVQGARLDFCAWYDHKKSIGVSGVGSPRGAQWGKFPHGVRAYVPVQAGGYNTIKID